MSLQQLMRMYGADNIGAYQMSPDDQFQPIDFGGQYTQNPAFGEQGNALAQMMGLNGDRGTVSTIPSTYAKDSQDLNTMFEGAIAGGDIDKAARLATTPQQRALLDAAYGQFANEREQRGKQAQADEQRNSLRDMLMQQADTMSNSRDPRERMQGSQLLAASAGLINTPAPAQTNMVQDYRSLQDQNIRREQGLQDRQMLLTKFGADQTKEAADIAAKNEALRVSKINTPEWMSTTPGTPGANLTPPPSGPELLKSLPQGVAAQVQAMLDGRMAPPTAYGIAKSPQMRQMMDIAGRVDPNFDLTTWASRAATEKDFSSAGKSGQKVQAINQALHHAASLSDSIDKLDNTNVAPGLLNPVINFAQQKLLGDTRQGTFKINADALSAELRKVYSGASGGSLTELKEWQSAFDPNAGKDQQKAYLQKGMQLLQGGIDSLKENYTRGMGSRGDFSKLVSPTAQADLDRIMSGTSSGAHPEDIQKLLSKYGK